MLQTIRYSLLVFISVASVNLSGSPLFKIGDMVDIYLTAHTDMRYESNIFLNSSDRDDDFIYTVEPGVEMVFGSSSIFGLTFAFYESMEFYFDNTELTNYAEHLVLNAFYDGGGVTSFKINASYHPEIANTGSENVDGALIRSRNYDLGIDANFNVSNKSKIGSGLAIKYTDYRNFLDQFSNSMLFTAPLSYLYEISPRLEVGGAYRYRYTDFERRNDGFKSPDRTDHAFSFLANTQISSKLRNETAIGVQIRHVNGLDTTADLSIDNEFTWEATQKIQLVFGTSRDFRSTGSGNSVKDTTGFFNVVYSATDKIRFDLMTMHSYDDYESVNREDSLTTIGASMTYVLNPFFQANIAYVYLNNHSTFDGIGFTPTGGVEPNASFNAHTVQIGASIKY